MAVRTLTDEEALEILGDEDAKSVPYQAINEKGLKEIAKFLADNHRLGGGHFSENMLSAWAQDAEFQLSCGNGASIEISSWDSNSGHTVTFTVPNFGFEWRVCV